MLQTLQKASKRVLIRKLEEVDQKLVDSEEDVCVRGHDGKRKRRRLS